jgi:deoxyhypusine synthase
MHPHKPHYDRHAGSDANKQFLHKISRERIDPAAVGGGASAADLIDGAFLSYRAVNSS